MPEIRSEVPIIRKDDEFSHSKIFRFYSKLPEYKFLVLPKKFNESPIRPAIMTVLREGIYSKNGEEPIRYALTAQEIKEHIGRAPFPEVKNVTYTNLYFHLKKMLEAEVIQIVAYVIEGNHRIAFYGRTARLIFFNDPSSELKLYKSRFEELTRLIKLLDTEIDMQIFDNLPDQYYNDEETKARKIAKWMAKNEEVITGNGLNMDHIFKALMKIINSSNINEKAFKEVNKLF